MSRRWCCDGRCDQGRCCPGKPKPAAAFDEYGLELPPPWGAYAIAVWAVLVCSVAFALVLVVLELAL